MNLQAFVRELGLLMVDEVRISNRTLVHEPHKGLRTTAAERPPKRASRYVELSHRIRHGMITYPGLPGPEITDHLTREASRARYAPGTEFHIGRISMVANTGTYLDTPSHRFSDGADLAGVPLSRLCDLDGLVVRLAGDDIRAIDRQVLLPFDVQGRAVLLHTGWDRLWGTERYGSSHPYLTADGAIGSSSRAALVGIDSVNIDDAEDGNRPAHTALLRAGIPIVEHLCGLDELPPEGFRFFATRPSSWAWARSRSGRSPSSTADPSGLAAADGMDVLIDTTGWLGAIALLSAYQLVSAGRLDGHGAAFQLLNLAGATALLVNSGYHRAWPSAGLNAVWLAIGLIAWPGRKAPGSPAGGSGGAGHHHAGLVGDHHELGTIAGVELHQQPARASSPWRG